MKRLKNRQKFEINDIIKYIKSKNMNSTAEYYSQCKKCGEIEFKENLNEDNLCKKCSENDKTNNLNVELNQEAGTLLQVPPIKIGDWMITLLIASIPLVGFIMLFVWAFSGGENINKANWAKALLIWMIIGLALGILIMFLFFSSVIFSLHNL